MATHTHDSHVSVIAKALTEFFGVAAPRVELREIEGAPVVTHLGAEDSIKASGIALGEVVLKIDGEPVARSDGPPRSVYHRLNATGAYSYDFIPTVGRVAGLKSDSYGPRSRRQRARAATDPIRPGGFLAGPAEGGEVVQLLDSQIGYADLTRLTVAQVDAMFERFKDAKGIIFDMRGYPRGTAWAIAPRINTKEAVNAAEFRRPFVAANGFSYGGFNFLQPIPDRNGKPLYRGKTVMLIDERAISQSEHTGLFFEAANGTTFIGSPTMGANGDVTTLTVPGGIVISFSGHDVRHADGRQLQRVGLIPQIEVRPTIQGIREGRDEVLERAKKYLTDSAPDSGRTRPR